MSWRARGRLYCSLICAGQPAAKTNKSNDNKRAHRRQPGTTGARARASPAKGHPHRQDGRPLGLSARADWRRTSGAARIQ